MYIYIFVKCIPYSGLVTVNNNFLSLCNSESGFSKAVVAGLKKSVSSKICLFSVKE